MSDEAGRSAGSQFARDMRRVREERDVSLEEVHVHTQISRPLIEAFEKGELYDHPTFNEVYLRSFVRAYADVVGISPDTALAALESASQGRYQGTIAEEYLSTLSPSTGLGSGEAPEPDGDTSPSSEERATHRKAVSKLPRLVSPPSIKPETVQGSASSAPDPLEESERDSGLPDDIPHRGRLEKAGIRHVADLRRVEDLASLPGIGPVYASEIDSALRDLDARGGSEETSSDEVVSADPKRPAASELEGEGREGPPEPVAAPTGGARTEAEPDVGAEKSPASSGLAGPRAKRVGGLVGLAAVVLLGGLGMWYLFASSSGNEGGTVTSTTPEQRTASLVQGPDTAEAASDSTSKSALDTTPPDTAALLERLPQRLSLVMRADSIVEGIMVQRDEDLRRPYWIEQGEVVVFPFSSRIRIENGLDDVSLYLEGRPITPAPDSLGQVQIDRERAAVLMEASAGPSADWSTVPDTIPVGPPPSGESSDS